jgi:hypothetical protein
MAIADLKQWHWIGIGFVVGAALTVVRVSFPADERAGAVRTIGAGRFVQKVRASARDGVPALRGVTVHPPRRMASESGARRANYVTGEILETGADGRSNYVPFAFYAEIPFRVPGAGAAQSTTYSVLHHLAEASGSGHAIDYRYAWWETPRMITALWGGGSVLLIGGVWPMMLSLLIGAGFGGEGAGGDDDDATQRGAPGDGASTVTEPPPTADLLEHLHALESEMEAAAVTTSNEPPPQETAPAPAIRPLANDADAPSTVEQLEGPRDYRGEFYPVAKRAGDKRQV